MIACTFSIKPASTFWYQGTRICRNTILDQSADYNTLQHIYQCIGHRSHTLPTPCQSRTVQKLSFFDVEARLICVPYIFNALAHTQSSSFNTFQHHERREPPLSSTPISTLPILQGIPDYYQQHRRQHRQQFKSATCATYV